MENTKLKMIMLVGLPGSGKSTWLREQGVFDDVNSVVVSTDGFIEEKAIELGLTYNEVFSRFIRKASKNMNRSIMEAVNADKDIYWDQTNLTPKSRKKKLKMIPDKYIKCAAIFDVEDAVLAERLANRAKTESKSIPPHVLESMEKSFIAPTIEEGFDEVIKVASNGSSKRKR